jgi:hypothetical protein
MDLRDHGLGRTPHAHKLRHWRETGRGSEDEILARIPLAAGGNKFVPVMKASAEIEAGTKSSAGASQHDHLDVGIVHSAMNRSLYFVGHRGNNRIETIRPVECNRRNSVFDFVEQSFVLHVVPRASVRMAGRVLPRCCARKDFIVLICLKPC